jgi:hypothetical protein
MKKKLRERKMRGERTSKQGPETEENPNRKRANLPSKKQDWNR